MVRVDPRQRKDIVLSMVVHQYVQTLEPVSSAFIAEGYEQEVSSATIRNILAELEEEGYLTHPHTSAGRMPTLRGYRYFVDYLMKEICLLEEERIRIQREYNEGVRELQVLIEKTSRVMADLTHCASIVTIDGVGGAYSMRGTNYLASAVGTRGLQKMAEILQILEEKERVLEVIRRNLDQKISIYIGRETACSAFDDCAMAVAKFQTRRGPSGHIAVLGPARMDYERVVSVLECVAETIKETV